MAIERQSDSGKPRRRQIPYRPELKELVQAKRESSVRCEVGENDFKGWHERGYLPHRDEPGLVQFVTIRLIDSLPVDRRSEWTHLLEASNSRTERKKLESFLDKGCGGCWLKTDSVASMVEESLLFGNGHAHEIMAWAIMPNHVHVLLRQHESLGVIIGGWKKFSARRANRVLTRTGSFWAPDYWDTFMRDTEQERQVIDYIENNPVKARLSETIGGFRWSSARRRDRYGRLVL